MPVKKKSRYVIIRSYAMGCFAGYLDPSSTETCKILKQSRRLWQWQGAASLSQLAQEGTSRPNDCKFPCEVDSQEITSPQGFEVLNVTEKARISIAGVPVWRA